MTARPRKRQDAAPRTASERSTAIVERGEERRRDAVAHGRVGQRLEAVREHVLRHREVERPHQDRADEENIRRRLPGFASSDAIEAN